MNKKQAQRYHWLVQALESRGVDTDEVDVLLRAERTLHRWAERECNGEIQRDETTGIVHETSTRYQGHAIDRETGALKRVAAICEAHGLGYYHQTDPRGCALYIIRPGDVRDGATVESCYTNGIAVCVD